MNNRRYRVTLADLFGAGACMILFVCWIACQSLKAAPPLPREPGAPVVRVDALNPEFTGAEERAHAVAPEGRGPSTGAMPMPVLARMNTAAVANAAPTNGVPETFLSVRPDDEGEIDVCGTTKLWGGILGTAVGGYLAYAELEDTDLGDGNGGPEQFSAAELAAREQAAAERGELLGRTTPADVSVKYTITGRFTGAALAAACGAFTPAIAFGGPNQDFSGGGIQEVASFDACGSIGDGIGPGAWRQVDEQTIIVDGTTPFYAGTYRVEGASLVKPGLRLAGGSINPIYIERP